MQVHCTDKPGSPPMVLLPQKDGLASAQNQEASFTGVNTIHMGQYLANVTKADVSNVDSPEPNPCTVPRLP